MKKIYLLIILLLLVGCSTKEEDNKYAYLEYKNNLEEREEFDAKEELDFKLLFNVEKEEITKYSLVISEPKINMYNIKALLIHDGTNEEAYPTVGIFDKPLSLLMGIDNEIKLEGSTVNNIDEINFRLYIEYTDENNNEYKVYYKL